MGEFKKAVPNLITSLNLLCGAIALVFVVRGEHDTAVYLMIAALLFDFADGFVARLLKVTSPMGKELDSLADLVTFGVLPSYMMFEYIQKIACKPGVCTGVFSAQIFPFLAFVMTAASAWRLAKFNVDERQSDMFYGVPTPANAIFTATLPYLTAVTFLHEILINPKVVMSIVFVQSYLLVADIPMIALKFKNYTIKDNLFRYLLVLIGIVMLVLFGKAGVPLVVILYVLLSVIENLLKAKTGTN